MKTSFGTVFGLFIAGLSTSAVQAGVVTAQVRHTIDPRNHSVMTAVRPLDLGLERLSMMTSLFKFH